eukprot:9490208-Pyramimonas_sp.AAC.1
MIPPPSSYLPTPTAPPHPFDGQRPGYASDDPTSVCALGPTSLVVQPELFPFWEPLSSLFQRIVEHMISIRQAQCKRKKVSVRRSGGRHFQVASYNIIQYAAHVPRVLVQQQRRVADL